MRRQRPTTAELAKTTVEGYACFIASLLLVALLAGGFELILFIVLGPRGYR